MAKPEDRLSKRSAHTGALFYLPGFSDDSVIFVVETICQTTIFQGGLPVS